MKQWKIKVCMAVNVCANRTDEKAFHWAASVVNETADFEALANATKEYLQLPQHILTLINKVGN